jgi:hypothetical protein
MDEFFQKVTSQQDPFKKLVAHIPGFSGYVERQNRRDADKLLRDTVARRFDEQWQRTSQLQSDMVSSGMIAYVDDMEKAALKLRTFIDKISTAPRGYAGLFDALIHRQDGHITGAAKPSIVIQPCQVSEHAIAAVRLHQNTFYEVGTGQMQAFPGNFGGIETKQGVCFVTQQGLDISRHCGNHGLPPCPGQRAGRVGQFRFFLSTRGKFM